MNVPLQAERFDCYRFIHKALRALMCETLLAVGKMDPLDVGDVAITIERIRALTRSCVGHIQREDRHVHPRMEARAPGSSKDSDIDHTHHDLSIASLEADIGALQRSAGPARLELAHRLYRNLAVFIADQFLHMHVEETENNSVLWKHYSDEELLAMEGEIMASITEDELALAQRWLLPYLSPVERTTILSAMRPAHI
jgi:hypothetical protein